MAEQAKTTGTTRPSVKKNTTDKDASTTSVSPTSTSTTASPTSGAPSMPPPPPPPSLPAPSPYNGVRVNVASVEQAFVTASRARSIVHIQRALTDRGFTPGNVDGHVDHETRAAYARYQKSVNERPTGIPTAWSLDHLGFDVVG